MNKITILICLLGLGVGVNHANAQIANKANSAALLPDKSKVLTATGIPPITNPVVVLPALKPVEMKNNPYVGKYLLPVTDIPIGPIPSTIDPNLPARPFMGGTKPISINIIPATKIAVADSIKSGPNGIQNTKQLHP